MMMKCKASLWKISERRLHPEDVVRTETLEMCQEPQQLLIGHLSYLIRGRALLCKQGCLHSNQNDRNLISPFSISHLGACIYKIPGQ
ncbi:arf-GAP with Rho-GAP domain, ANK repeat and PH domain-containing protein 3-like [Clarias magur]|uniref:Arf-GAP with Rho-GAP domain, ANK repeat and PH domain-containing protein 3-like n=1 Tax=Clarias magur TaxID=1594786 RepID=A0A8J4U6B8_CLAMG|nr:arf-GAP with Rho-GAP domain, ANK repeat and PH domain-containing protein 3-like [Clarias magur]